MARNRKRRDVRIQEIITQARDCDDDAAVRDSDGVWRQERDRKYEPEEENE